MKVDSARGTSSRIAADMGGRDGGKERQKDRETVCRRESASTTVSTTLNRGCLAVIHKWPHTLTVPASLHLSVPPSLRLSVTRRHARPSPLYQPAWRAREHRSGVSRRRQAASRQPQWQSVSAAPADGQNG